MACLVRPIMGITLAGDFMRQGRSTSNVFRFGRHYLEMVLSMAVGMVVFGLLFRSPLDPTGYGAELKSRPFLSEYLMLLAMTIPMVAFMRYRNHAWRLTMEMVVGMVVPAVVMIVVTSSGLVPVLNLANLSVSSHAAMLLGMLTAMLLRRREYLEGHCHPVRLDTAT